MSLADGAAPIVSLVFTVSKQPDDPATDYVVSTEGYKTVFADLLSESAQIDVTLSLVQGVADYFEKVAPGLLKSVLEKRVGEKLASEEGGVQVLVAPTAIEEAEDAEAFVPEPGDEIPDGNGGWKPAYDENEQNAIDAQLGGGEKPVHTRIPGAAETAFPVGALEAGDDILFGGE